MPVTSIQNVVNTRNSSTLFINTESSGNNREIASESLENVGNCWIPWCTRESDFPAHHIEIIDTSSEIVLFYIWQRAAADGDFVRASTTGFEDPGPPISGDSRVGRSYDLWVDPNTVRTT
jgi:hypothetical protein